MKKLCLPLLLLAACAPAPLYTATGPTLAPRTPGCDFQVMTTAPATNFVELGTLDFYKFPHDIGTFKTMVAPEVCKAGGDAALAVVNGHGQYVKATVIALKNERATPQ